MSNDSNTPNPPSNQNLLVFPPIPLASGETHSDADGGKRLVTGVTVLVSLEGTSEPNAVSLEYRFGGWWAPAKPTFEPGESRR